MAQLNANLLAKIANPQEDYHQNMLNEQAIQANEMKMQAAQRDEQSAAAQAQIEKVGRVLYSADTPEKWAQGISYLESQGIEVDEHERDFANRDAILGELTSVADQMKQGVDLQKLAIDRQNAGANMLRAQNAGATAQVKPQSAIGKLEADRRAGLVSDEQVKAETERMGGQKKGLSATELRFKRESENNIVDLSNTLKSLDRALKLVPDSFEGAGASTRAFAGSKLPDMLVPDFVADPKTAAATTEFMNIMAPAAIQQMADTLKGATTNFELQEFKRILSDPAQPAELKKRTINRMMKLAQDQLALEEQRINEFKSTPEPESDGGDGKSEEAAGTTFDENARMLLEQARDALEAGAPEDQVLQRLEELDIDTSELR